MYVYTYIYIYIVLYMYHCHCAVSHILKQSHLLIRTLTQRRFGNCGNCALLSLRVVTACFWLNVKIGNIQEILLHLEWYIWILYNIQLLYIYICMYV